MPTNKLTEYQIKILARINQLYNAERFYDAAELAIAHFATNLRNTPKGDRYFKISLSGLLIDTAESAKSTLTANDPLFKYFEHTLILILDFFKENISEIQKYLKNGTVNYWYGNAASSLLDYKRRIDPDYLNPRMADLLNLSRTQFLRSLKQSPSNKLDVKTNLAHALTKCSRVIEAIRIYDEVLAEDPDHFEALYSRSQDIEYLNHLNSSYSIKMLYEVAAGYNRASQAKNILSSMRQKARNRYQQALNILEEHGKSEKDFEDEVDKNTSEFKSHSQRRQFFLKSGLSLSEHGIYCHCSGAAHDCLSIIPKAGKIGGYFIPRHEYILNQLKTEFANARLNYHRATTEPSSFYQEHDQELQLSNFGGNEILNGRSEDLKSSFRLCFGILDRIAQGVCELFELPTELGEKIYFESFWKGRANTEVEIQRWKTITSIAENPSLFALYYQAHDLDSKKGEWRHFKTWRNALEHGFFVIHSGKTAASPYRAIESKFPVIKMNYDEFSERTKDLLGFTRSAIFNYAYCVRTEGRKSLDSTK